jgi:hypothetical protein
MRAGVLIHRWPTSPGGQGGAEPPASIDSASAAWRISRVAPQGSPIRPSAGVNGPIEVPATQLPVSVSP